MAKEQEALEGLDDGVKVALGFGGKTLTREQPLRIGDNLYLLLHCEIVSDGRSKKQEDDGKLSFKAGAKTSILAELDEGQATKVAASFK